MKYKSKRVCPIILLICEYYINPCSTKKIEMKISKLGILLFLVKQCNWKMLLPYQSNSRNHLIQFQLKLTERWNAIMISFIHGTPFLFKFRCDFDTIFLFERPTKHKKDNIVKKKIFFLTTTDKKSTLFWASGPHRGTAHPLQNEKKKLIITSWLYLLYTS